MEIGSQATFSIHPAIVQLEAIGAQPRKLTSHETAFALNVHRITERTRETRRSAAELFTVGSGAYDASVWLAMRQEASDLDYALVAFNAQVA